MTLSTVLKISTRFFRINKWQNFLGADLNEFTVLHVEFTDIKKMNVSELWSDLVKGDPVNKKTSLVVAT